ncbi:hypothetical protein EMPS_05239 [Entomortierella parvispora]|uniref:Uncharacterized protein n=1 Tax=Entomortierella parvispora TaxID=205924 RepID=A0A9P3LW58_9FUNG|nr:hypothetical protein EMPS_05239 [Entomortierella parvispora]
MMVLSTLPHLLTGKTTSGSVPIQITLSSSKARFPMAGSFRISSGSPRVWPNEDTSTSLPMKPTYIYNCAVTPDQKKFMVHVKPLFTSNIDVPQLFSIQVLLDEVNGTDNGYRQIQLALDDLQKGFFRNSIDMNEKSVYHPPWTMISVQAVAADPSAHINVGSEPGHQPYGDWIHISQPTLARDISFSYSQSLKASFPSQLMDGYLLRPDPSEGYLHLSSFAFQGNTLYGLYHNNESTISSTTLRYNTSSSQMLEAPLENTRTWSLPSELQSYCGFHASIAVKDSVLYALCTTGIQYDDDTTLVRIDTSTNITTKIPVKVDISKVDWTLHRVGGDYTSSLHIVNDGLLIYHISWLQPTSLFSIDTHTGELKSLMIDQIPTFSGSNPNRNMTARSITLATWESILITLGALIMGLFVIWGQGVRDKRRYRLWIDFDDIPGSKLADTTNEVTFEAHQRAHQEEMERQQPQQHRSTGSESNTRSSPQSPQSLPQMLTAGEQTSWGSRTSLLRASGLRDDDTMDRSGVSSPYLYDQSLASLQFSSHPRPNIVTTIADDLEE